MEAGRELFNLQCLSCHTINGIRNDIVTRTAEYPYMGVMALLDGQGKVMRYMPPFMGTAAERNALASYIVSELNDHTILEQPEPYALQPWEDVDIPAYNEREDQYLLLAWNDLGMHCLSDADAWFVILPPANTIEAQLIKRGPVPEIISDGVQLSYTVQKGFENPSAHVDFWKYSKHTFGVELEDNVGLGGLGMTGDMTWEDDPGGFIAKMIPVVPYPDEGAYNPFPAFTIEAKDMETGDVLASTRVVAPVSTEFGCRNCHGGEWRWKGVSGMTDETAIRILEAHDRISGTDLLAQAKNGKPRLCQECHADPAVGAEGKPDVLNFSAAMHGWHANYMVFDGAAACAMCHPANLKGNTRCARGIHSKVNVTCIDCHGSLQEHALGLLRGEEEKPRAKMLMANLTSKQVESVDEVNPRTPWLKEPDCLNCHVDFEKPEPGASGYNQWTEGPEELYRIRTDNAGIRCPACHGATHAEYPASNAYSPLHDNIQPLQYTGHPYPIGANMKCETCHIIKMEDPIHHENMMRTMRNPVH